MPAPALLNHDPAREEAELRSYLGDGYSRHTLENYQDVLDREAREIGDEAELYRTSQAYLYNLTVFAMSPTKLPYLRELTELVPPGSRLLDYGCGIGSDGLMLIDAGYRVEFVDFDNPCTRYLRWRLEQRGIDAPVHDLDGDVPGGFDAAYAFDVIEHVPDPYAFLREMERRAKLVEVNLLEFDEHEQELHHELPVNKLVRYAADRELETYRIYHGTSHLVLYRPDKVSPARRLVNRLRVARRRMRRRR
ncbi:MAG: class I SAM-dependent methyltransferase [Thermoleophilaceae bacterium]